MKDNGAKYDILFAEDDERILLATSTILKKISKEFFLAKDGEEAWELYKKNRPQIVIIDNYMPKMMGIEVSRLIKENNEDVFVILVTALSDDDVLSEAFEIGIDAFLPKPYDFAKIKKTIGRFSKIIKDRERIKEQENLLSQYQKIVDLSAIVTKTDTSGVITYVNKKFCDISQYSKEELIGKNHNIIRHKDMDKEAFRDLWETISAKRVWRGKVKNRKKDGSYYIVDATIMPILDNSGEIIEYVALRYDITELEEYRKNTEEKLFYAKNDLRESMKHMAQYEDAVNTLVMIIRCDSSGKILFFNERFLKISRFSRNKLSGINIHDIVCEDDVSKAIKEAIERRDKWSGTSKIRCEDGVEKFFDLSLSHLFDFDGKYSETIIVMHDISEIVELNQEIESTQKEVIFTIGAIGESRSKETGNHVKRVAEYSYILAELIGMKPEERELLKYASPLHDIGKVAIPDSILNKPGKLESDEWEVMKRHSEIGYELLKHSKRRLFKTAAIVAREHHEQWQGGGYPRGLKGEEIHIYGRITSLADVFDALGSDRCYKKAWPIEKIYSFIKEQRGKIFDPTLCDLFIKNFDLFLEVKNRYRDSFE